MGVQEASPLQDNASHKHAVSSTSDGKSFGYDANGNMTSRTISGVTYTLAYDAENRLVSFTGGGITASFVYDGDGNRVQGTVSGVTTTYIGNLAEYSGGTFTRYIYAGSQRIAMYQATTLSYLASDHLGSTSVTYNSSGGLVAARRYMPWGAERYSSGAMPTTYRYTGQRFESSLGLYYYGARFYDPAIGRFISPDSIVPLASQGVQAWDRYAYLRHEVTGMIVSRGNPDETCRPIGSIPGKHGRRATSFCDSFTGNGLAAARLALTL